MHWPPMQIRLSSKDRQQLQDHLSGGVQPVRSVLRALVLLQMADEVSASQIARFVPLTAQAIRKVGHRFEQGGLLDRALFDKSRPGAASLLDAAQPTQAASTDGVRAKFCHSLVGCPPVLRQTALSHFAV